MLSPNEKQYSSKLYREINKYANHAKFSIDEQFGYLRFTGIKYDFYSYVVMVSRLKTIFN